MRILLAEDEDLSAQLLERILHPILTQFDVTKTLRDTLFKVKDFTYDLILLDLRLLDSDANQTISAIPVIKRCSNTPLLVVTGMPNPDIKQKCMDAGADGFLPKIDAYTNEANALLMAVYACAMHARGERGEGFMDRVRVLEELVHAA